MGGYLLIGLHRWLLTYRGLLLIRLLLTKCGGNIGSFLNDMNMSSVGDAICHNVFIFISILGFVIVWTSILGVFLVKFDDTILDEHFFKSHPFFFNVFLFLQKIHNHVMGKIRMCIIYEHFDKVTF